MIEKEDLLKKMNGEDYNPLPIEDLLAVMEIAEDDVYSFMELLRKCEQKGEIVVTKKKRYALPKHVGFILGVLQGNARGFGFVIPLDMEEREKGDLFISPDNLHGAMDKDHVLVRPFKKAHGEKREGTIERVAVRKNETIVGTYQKNKNFGFLIPDNLSIGKDIYIKDKKSLGAKTGQKVVGEITKWPVGEKAAEGRIVEILGYPDEVGVDILSVIKSYELPLDFPKDVLEEAAKMPQTIENEDLSGRKDLRHLATVTIDGADARDLDDAVTISKDKEGNFLLGVHIADVSHYVKKNTVLEKEAHKRATSVYFPDRVIPMLPVELSNGICSLNAKVDRLSMSCEMVINHQGKVLSSEIGPSVIQVDERMNYADVTELLEGDDVELKKRYQDFLPMFKTLAELRDILKSRRMKRGAIDFEFPEVKVVMNDDGTVKELKIRSRTISESIIEECMLVANETVAEHLHWLEMPTIYRVHESPSLEKIERLNNMLKKYDLKVEQTGEDIQPRVYAELMEKIKGEPYEEELSIMLLRSMMHARYLPESVGHFGLAATYYCHFTSPIRRYPDLFVHRSLKRARRGTMNQKNAEKWYREAEKAASVSSEQELVAEEAEREAVKLKVVEYMAGQVGEVFDAKISGVIASGFFVRLDNLAEGLVKVGTLGDQYYTYDEAGMSMVGEKNGKTYRLGDTVKVQLVRADEALRQLDFEIVK
ncbi:ribonuclease R [Clostridia bacterium]|nr:ribonuclease R [Clostridia bacterium]